MSENHNKYKAEKKLKLYQSSDLVLYLIKSENEINVDSLFDKYEDEFNFYSIDKNSYYDILERLKEEKKIKLNNKIARVALQAIDFSHEVEVIRGEHESKKKQRISQYLNHTPIVLSFITLVATILIALFNNEPVRKELELSIKKQSDSLTEKIQDNKNSIDSISNIINRIPKKN